MEDTMNKKCDKNCSCAQYEETIIEALQKEMSTNGWISEDAIRAISKRLGKAESEIYGVATFYSQFSLEKTAKYTISVCTGTTCFILGADKILEEICSQLNIKPNTLSEDGKWYVSTARCLGCCGMAPVISINGEVFGNLKPNMVKDILAKFE